MSVLAEAVAAPGARLDIRRIREDFPILSIRVNGKPLVYLDNAATSQKPVQVIDAVARYYREENANIHRGVHRLSELATAAYEASRETIARFLQADSAQEIIFTRGTTEAINLVAQSYGRATLAPGDEIILSELEHHSNIVPWQIIARQTGSMIKVIPVTDSGDLDISVYQQLLSSRTKIVAVTQLSNVTGTRAPVRHIADLAHQAGAVVLVDGAQSLPHLPVNLKELGCDFFACSGHKALGPTGIGILWGRVALLDEMPPYQGGGGMINTVTFRETTFAPSPARFEAGTPHVSGAIGFAAALDYLSALGPAAHEHEADLLARAAEGLAREPRVRLIGAGPGERSSLVSFTIDGVHPHDAATILDQEGIAVRGGHHCAQPLMARFGVPGTLRASFSFYNTAEEVDALCRGVRRVTTVFA